VSEIIRWSHSKPLMACESCDIL